MPLGIKYIEKEMARGVYLAFQSGGSEATLRLFMAIARWRLSDYTESSLIFHGSSNLDAWFKKIRTTLKVQAPYAVDQNMDCASDLSGFDCKNIFSSANGSIHKIDEILQKNFSGSKCPNLFFIFRDNQSDMCWLELKHLVSRYSTSVFVSMPKLAYPAPFHSTYELIDINGISAQLKIMKARCMAATTAAENILTDVDGIYVPNTTSATAQLTIHQVTAELYDLRSFADQQKNPDKVKALLDRYAELNPKGPKRPIFMS